MSSPVPLAYSGPELRKALLRFGVLLRDSAEDVATPFRSKLKALGFTSEQRVQLLSITPGAAVHAIEQGQPPRQFFDSAAVSSRRLALSGVERRAVQQAIEEYVRLANAQIRKLPKSDQAEIRVAQTQVHTALLLLISDVFACVLDEEARLLGSILAAEDSASALQEFAEAVLNRLVQHFGADGAAWFCNSERGMVPLARAGTPAEVEPIDGPGPHHDRDKFLTLSSRDRSDSGRILVKAWRSGTGSVWSISAGENVIQLRHTRVREAHAREIDVLAEVAQHCRRAAERLARQSELRALSLRMLEVEENERRRISRELHDDAGQSLVVIRLQLELMELSLGDESDNIRQSAAEIRSIVERTILGVRRLISDLSPAVLEQLGLGAAIRQLTKRFRSSSEIDVILKISDLPRLNPRLELVIYRILQECFANIARHSSAKTVKVSLEVSDNMLRLTVEDDGRGFEVAEGLSRRNSFGLRGIRERTELLGGRFEITSTPVGGDKRANLGGSAGTKVSIQLPLPG